MQAIDAVTANEANYRLRRADDNIEYRQSIRELSELFNKHKSAFVETGECSIPLYWGPAVLSAVLRIVAFDDNVVFINIKEKNSKLMLDLWYPRTKPEFITDIIWDIKNKIDQLVHQKVRIMMVRRKFSHAPRLLG